MPLFAQDATPIEVLAGPGRPSTLLQEHLAAHREEFVVFDLGLFVQVLAGAALGAAWARMEAERHDVLHSVLTTLVARSGKPPFDGDPLAGMTRAAAALLTGSGRDIDRVPQPWQGDVRAVLAGRSSVLRWLPGKPAVDWRVAVPNGAYDVTTPANLSGLFRATSYLRECLARLPDPLGEEWRRRCTTAFDEPGKAAAARVDAMAASLLGLDSSTMPGMLGELPSARDRDVLRAASGAWWERLAAVHGDGVATTESGFRGALLRVAHELATEEPSGATAPVFANEACRRRRLDLADFTYVAVREVDVLAGVRGILPDNDRPRLLVEPMPRTIVALRAACDAASQAWGRVDGSAGRFDDLRAILDDLVVLLAHQQALTEPPAALLDSLWAELSHGFDEQPARQGVATRLEGIDGALRRRGPYLVRIPIVWEGQPKTAITFQWFVEHETADGTWERANRTAGAKQPR